MLSRLTIALIGLYAIWDATAPRSVPFRWPSYALVFLALLAGWAIAVFGRGRMPVIQGLGRVILIWLLVGTAFLFTAFLDDTFYWYYVAADFIALVGFPLLLLLIGSADVETFAGRRSLSLLLILLVGSALVGPLGPHLWGGQFSRGVGGRE